MCAALPRPGRVYCTTVFYCMLATYLLDLSLLGIGCSPDAAGVEVRCPSTLELGVRPADQRATFWVGNQIVVVIVL